MRVLHGRLNLLDVNELHYVSSVAPFAPQLRYSITGWLRESPPHVVNSYPKHR